MKFLFKRSAILGLAASLALTLGTGIASAAAGYGNWRIAYHVALKVSSDWYSLVAPSRDQAWAIGFKYTRRGVLGEFLDHWNGKRWRLTPVPGTGFTPLALAASGPGNVWLFSSYGRALRWDGHRWERVPNTRGVQMGAPVVLSPSDVWTAGVRLCGTSILYHWDGSRWSEHTVHAAIDSMSGSSPKNFWVLTQPWANGSRCIPARGARLTALRWDGRSFRRMPVPRVVNAKGQNGGQIAVTSTRSIWIANASIGTIAHWNGHRWARLNERAAGQDVPPGPIVPDGHGGAWIGGCFHWSRGTWHGIYGDICNVTRGIARIPGTRSAWGLGLARFNSRVEGTIEVNGPIP